MRPKGYIYLDNLDSTIPFPAEDSEKIANGELIILPELTVRKYQDIFRNEPFRKMEEIMKSEEFSPTGIGEFAAIEDNDNKIKVLEVFEKYIEETKSIDEEKVN